MPELVYTEDLKKVLNFTLIPHDPDEPFEKFAFNWSVVSFNKEESTIKFKIDFEYPDDISMSE